jgi:hypothetical protein
MAKKQKDAVFEAIVAVRGTDQFAGAVELSKEERQKVSASLVDGFKNGDIEFSDVDISDAKKLSSYVSGLVSNWLRKDKRLNGNTTYQPKNPGTRVGQGDDAVKAMRQLLDLTEDPDARADIEAEIAKRLGELKPKPEIDTSKLPESLRHIAAKQQ